MEVVIPPKKNRKEALTVGIDSNKEIGTDGSKALYMFNGAFTPLERYQKCYTGLSAI